MKRHILKISVSLILSVSVLVIYQNCTQQIAESRLTQSDNNSPFDVNKVQLSDEAMKRISLQGKSLLAEDGSTTLNAGVELVAIVSERCLRDRRGDLGAAVHFVEKYLAADFYQKTNERFDQLALKITLQRSTSLNLLQRLFARDKCLIGLSDDQVINVKVTAVNDPQAHRQDYLSRIRYDDGESLIPKTTSDQRVVTAVIDSGFDMSNQDKPLYFSPLLLGTDLSSNPFMPGNNLSDNVGHGTFIGTLLASPENNGIGIRGLVGTRTELLPIKVVNSAQSTMTFATLFMAIRRAVNGGAEVINLSLGGSDPLCSPLLGQAIYYGIERGAFFVMAAGNGLTTNANGDPVPGEIISPRDIGPLPTGTFYAPACWGRYFKGAITVAALQPTSNTVASFSNYGAWGVEMAAPGEGITSYGRSNLLESKNGTSFAATFVTAAAVKAISHHKKNGWRYSPWLIEDTLINAMPQAQTLTSQVRNGKYLDWKNLSEYLISLGNMTAVQRLQQPTDDNEQGSGLNVPQTLASTISRLEIFSRESIVYNQTDRVQFQVVAYYQNGSYKVVTRDATITSMNGDAISVDANGVGYPNANFTGSVEVRASYLSKTASTNLNLVGVNISTGKSDRPTRLRLTTTPLTINNTLLRGHCPVEAIYEDGSTRYVTHMASFASSEEGLSIFNAWPKGTGCLSTGRAFGNRQTTVYAMYRGMYTTATLDLPREQFSKAAISITNFDRTFIFPDSPLLRVRVGGVISITPGAAYKNADEVSIYRVLDEKITSPDCPDLDAALKVSYSNINTMQLTPRRCTLHLEGEFRGSGVAQAVSQNYAIELVPDPLIDFSLEPVKVYKSAYQTILSVRGVNESGSLVRFPTGAVTLQILNSNSELSPLNYVSMEILGAFYTSINSASEGEQMIFRLRHIASGLQKDIRINMEPMVNSCVIPSEMVGLTIPQAYPPSLPVSTYCNSVNRALSPVAGGAGTLSDPYRICTPAQLLRASQAATGGWRVYYALEDNLDFSSLGNMSTLNPASTIARDSDYLDGKGFEIRNVTMIDSEKDEVGFIRAWSVSNLRMSNFLIQGRSNVNVLTIMESDNNYFKNSTVIGVNGVNYVKGGTTIKRTLITASTLKGQSMVGAFSAAKIFASYIDLSLERNGVPGTGTRAGIVTDLGQGNGYIYDMIIRGRSTGLATSGGVVGDYDGCIKNVDAQLDVVTQGMGGGIAGSFICGKGPYTGTCGIENVQFQGTVSGQDSVGAIAGSMQTARVRGVASTATVAAVKGCGTVAGTLYGRSVLENNNTETTFSCAVAETGHISGKYRSGKNIANQDIQIWSTESGNSFVSRGDVPTKKYGVCSIGDPQ